MCWLRRRSSLEGFKAREEIEKEESDKHKEKE
jgi:hypothetical protein